MPLPPPSVGIDLDISLRSCKSIFSLIGRIRGGGRRWRPDHKRCWLARTVGAVQVQVRAHAAAGVCVDRGGGACAACAKRPHRLRTPPAFRRDGRALKRSLAGCGVAVLADIDHAMAATAVGLGMPPSSRCRWARVAAWLALTLGAGCGRGGCGLSYSAITAGASRVQAAADRQRPAAEGVGVAGCGAWLGTVSSIRRGSRGGAARRKAGFPRRSLPARRPCGNAGGRRRLVTG